MTGGARPENTTVRTVFACVARAPDLRAAQPWRWVVAPLDSV
ncbi:hypothetical protein [Nocardia mangyaensis]|nr:hypothetical protein [Nocardia mangyaensis]MDO3646971.1 hypothetical protein [Nocardia mangyaensis]